MPFSAIVMMLVVYDFLAGEVAMKIIVDADACPRTVLEICFDLGRKNGLPVWTVASFNHNIQSDRHVIVGSDPQEADIKLMNLSEKGDIAVTQDWGLAAMLTGKEVLVINPIGKIYRPETIDFMLEEREIKAKYRRSGGRTKGPGKRTTKEDNLFRENLKALIESST